MYLPWEARGEISMEESIKHEYFQKCRTFPGWYDPTIRTKGRVFVVVTPGDCVGWVTVNDAAGTVYVRFAD